jgi:hypothetical protein
VFASLPAFAVDPTLFVCVTSPSLPGLLIRIETLTFCGWTCCALDRAAACCEVVADCVAACTGGGAPSANATAADVKQTAVVIPSATINLRIPFLLHWIDR